MRKLLKGIGAAVLGAIVAAGASGGTVHAARMGSAPSARPETASDASDLRPPDPQKQLRQLSKNLKLKRDQRVGVGSILQERAREIRLLLDVELLSQQRRDMLAAKVMEDSNAQIEILLKNNQKRKFDKVLARDQQGIATLNSKFQ